jgi:hypothetical protein
VEINQLTKTMAGQGTLEQITAAAKSQRVRLHTAGAEWGLGKKGTYTGSKGDNIKMKEAVTKSYGNIKKR